MGTATNKNPKSGKALLFAAALLSGALASSSAFAGQTFNVDGIEFGLNSNFIANTIWENTVTAAGQTLTGIGKVDHIDALACGGTCWQNGDNGRELTFQFSYFVEREGVIGGNQAEALFSGGTITFYSDHSPDLDNTTTGLTLAHATDGDVWLTLTGADAGVACNSLCFNGSGAVVTLASSFFIGTGLADVSSGQGHGFLDVTGGDAGSFFNTNSFFGGSDIDLGSSFHNNQITPGNFPLAGTAELNTLVNPVPEPGSLLLLGTGLLSLAGSRFRKRRPRA